MTTHVTVRAASTKDEFGPWQEILVAGGEGDGFWFNVTPSPSADMVTVEIGRGEPGNEVERCDIELRPQGSPHFSDVLVFEAISMGTRLAARFKSADPVATATVQAGIWNRNLRH